jgi:pimeloyl-ACP methyl ester carboxylesterase
MLDVLDRHVPVALEHRWLARAWGRQHVVLAGPREGTPILLLHGWPEHWFAWRRVIPALVEDGRRVVAIDLRDFGWSRSDACGRPDIGAVARDVVDAMDDLGIPRAALVSHDWGGWIGFRAVLDHPSRFAHHSALGIIPPWLDPKAMVANVLGWGYVFFMAPLGPRVARTPGAVRFLFDHSTTAPIWTEPEHQVALSSYLACIGTDRSARMTGHLYRLLVGRELPAACGPRPPRLTVPTTMVIGEDETIARPVLYDDRTFPGELARVVVPGVRHWVAEEAPQAVIDHVLAVRDR